LQAHGFRFYFTPLAAVLFTFPSRYWFTIGRQLVFSLTEWSPRIHTPFHVWRITQELPRVSSDFDYGGFTLCAGAFHLLHLSSKIPRRGPTTPGASSRFGLVRFRSPLLTESILFLFLRLLRCFTSPGFACFFLPSSIATSWLQCQGPLRVPAGFGKRRQGINPARLPHSEISGSKRMCRSPKLIAACHVLHRLLAPRHPLCALQSLIPCLKSAVLSGRPAWHRPSLVTHRHAP
jgi:hypothetical protein